MSEKFEQEYDLPKNCEKCGSENLFIRVIVPINGLKNMIVRYVCEACLYSRSVPRHSSLKKRTNTTLAHWAEAITIRNQSDESECYICGSKEDLEAHHIIPVSHSERFKYNKRNGIVLCRECHYLVHHKEEI